MYRIRLTRSAMDRRRAIASVEQQDTERELYLFELRVSLVLLKERQVCSKGKFQACLGLCQIRFLQEIS